MTRGALLVAHLVPVCLFLVSMALARGQEAGSRPSLDGLQLWLDAADAKTIAADGNGIVMKWLDKSGQDHHAVRGSDKSRAKRVEDAMNGKPVIRFGGSEHFRVPAIRDAKGPVTVFVVSQRSADQASDKKWQRLVSAWDGQSPADNKSPSFCFTVSDGKENGGGGAYKAAVHDRAYTDVKIGTVAIAGSAKSGGQLFRGDIAEVLVYDRGFVSEDAIQLVLGYLSKKWGARVARVDEGWTRTGVLGDTPKAVADTFPLSDQANKGGWTKYEPVSDEFEGTTLDETKWWPKHMRWKGRHPAFFWTENVAVSDGKLHLMMRKQEAPEMPKGYHTYTSACVHSKTDVTFGYFEIKAKPMKSAGSSSFWFAGRNDEWRTEIDVFEIGGAAPGFERKYNMNLHVFYCPAEKRHWSRGGKWIAPWHLADDYHVYGLEWDEKEVKYYVDGVVVRRVENTHWHQPLYMIFDSETMPNWFGMPKDEDLPSTYSVEYVRSWKKEQK